MLAQSTTPSHGLDSSTDDAQQASKRTKLNPAGEYSSDANQQQTTPAIGSATTSSSIPPSAAPLPTPLSSLLTSQPPAWMSEVPSFLESIQQHEPTIPDEVVQQLLERSGCNCPDPKLIRLVAIATQHFLGDVMNDARQYHKLRSKEKTSSSELTLSDLSSALSGHGITLSKPEYFADSVFSGAPLNVNAAVMPTQSGMQATSAGTGKKSDSRRKQ